MPTTNSKTPAIPLRFILIFWLFLLSAIAFLDRTNISIAGSSISAEYHLGNIRLGWIFSSFLVGYASFQVVGGWLAGRVGPRRLLPLGILWWGIFTGLTAAVPARMRGALLALMAIRFALGAGESFFYPTSNQFIARWIPAHERGKANGWIFAGVGAGSGLTPLLLTALIARWGWRTSFWFSAVVGLIAAAVWYVIARDTPDEHPYISESERETIRAGLHPVASREENRPGVQHPDKQTSPPQADSAPPIPWRSFFRSRDLLALTLSYFTFGYVAWVFFSWFNIYLKQARGLDLKTSAVYTMLPFLAMTVCCLIGGVLNDWMTHRYGLRVGRCALGFLALIATAAFLAFGSTIHSAPVASFILAGGAGALYFSQSSYWSVTVDLAGARSGIASGIMNLGCQIGAALTASLTPLVASKFGWTAAFMTAAALAVLGGVAWLLVDPRRTLVDSTLPASQTEIDVQFHTAAQKRSQPVRARARDM